MWGVCALGLPYLLLLWGLRSAPSLSRATLLVCVVAALLMRLCGVLAGPLLSDDVFRYVWDGRVWAAGINPYIHAPASPMLAHLRDAIIWPHINHPDIPTIYPPLAQLVFLITAMMGWGVTGLKAIFVGVELGCMGLAATSFRRLGWSSRRIIAALLVVALNPLMVIETAWSGHLDVLACWPLALGFLWVERLHHARSARARAFAMGTAGVLLGWSIGAKLLGVILLPLCATKARFLWGIGIVITALGLTFVSALPLLKAGGEMTTGFRTYAASWRHNDGPFRLLVRANHHALFVTARDAAGQHTFDGTHQDLTPLIRLQGLDDFFMEKGWTKTWQGQTLPNTTFTHDQVAQGVSKFLVAGLMALLLLWTLLITGQPLLAAPLLLGAFFFLSPPSSPGTSPGSSPGRASSGCLETIKAPRSSPPPCSPPWRIWGGQAPWRGAGGPCPPGRCGRSLAVCVRCASRPGSQERAGARARVPERDKSRLFILLSLTAHPLKRLIPRPIASFKPLQIPLLHPPLQVRVHQRHVHPPARAVLKRCPSWVSLRATSHMPSGSGERSTVRSTRERMVETKV